MASSSRRRLAAERVNWTAATRKGSRLVAHASRRQGRARHAASLVPMSACSSPAGTTSCVESVVEAHQVLSDCPMSGRGTDHELAVDACRSALAGMADADLAREGFERFARKRGILAPEAMMASANHFARDWFNG
ncbi:MAG: DUF982 domain-containing protein [Mesorhizobium sp.]